MLQLCIKTIFMLYQTEHLCTTALLILSRELSISSFKGRNVEMMEKVVSGGEKKREKKCCGSSRRLFIVTW